MWAFACGAVSTGASLEDLARECKMELEDAEEVLKIIQNFDPLGPEAFNVFARAQELVKVLQERLQEAEQTIQQIRVTSERRPSVVSSDED